MVDTPETELGAKSGAGGYLAAAGALAAGEVLLLAYVGYLALTGVLTAPDIWLAALGALALAVVFGPLIAQLHLRRHGALMRLDAQIRATGDALDRATANAVSARKDLEDLRARGGGA